METPSINAESEIVKGGPSLIDSLPVWTTSKPFCIQSSETLLAVSESGAPLTETLNMIDAISPLQIIL